MNRDGPAKKVQQKTIGPMVLVCNEWILSSQLPPSICNEELQKYVNIPDTATKLWVTLTKQCPKHGDAFRVRFIGEGYASLDDSRRARVYIRYFMRHEAADFGDDFYATLHYV